MKNSCVEVSICGEKNYKLFLDVMKQELDLLGYTDITAVQALILLNLGENVVTVSEVISRGYYTGSNASYNIKKLIKNGYIVQYPSEHDKRAAFLKLTPKGIDLCEKIDKAIASHVSPFTSKLNGKFDMQSGIEFLKSVGGFWKDLIQSRL